MNKKKMLYTGIGIAAVILGYFNYFGSDKDIGNVKKIMETTNAVYENEDYYVEAEKEIDYIDEKESKFEKAKAKIKGMLLSGDNVFLDKARNLLLNSNIVGISPNGWKINASELKYNRETEELISTQPLSAINEEKGIEISGNIFKTTVAMDNISLEGNVVIKNQYFSILADRANYNDKDKKIFLDGNIKITNSSKEKDTESTKKNREISGNFSKLYLNVDEKNIYATDGFEMKYSDVGLKGKDIVLNEETQSFKVTGDVQFTYQDYVFDVNYIEKTPNSDLINVYGKIKGRNPEYTLEADNAEYNMTDKKFRIFNNVQATSQKGEKLLVDNFIYSSETKEIDMYGNKILYTSPTNNLEAEYIHYNTVTKDLSTNKYFNSWNDKGEGVTGTNLLYNLSTKNFSSKEEITVKSKDYGLTSKNVTYVEETGILNVPEPYVIKSSDETTIINGNSITYNKKTGELVSPGNIILNSKGTIMRGHDLTYNNLTSLGKLEGPITLENKTDNMSGSAKEIQIKRGDHVTLVGPIDLKQNNMKIALANARYSYKDGLMHSDTPIKLSDPSRSMVGSVSNATYDPKTSVFKGNSFNMKETNRSARGNTVILNNKTKVLELIGNAYLSSGKDSVTGPKIVYNLDSKDAELPSSGVIKYDKYTLNTSYGKVNKETGEIFSKNSKVVSTDGNEFQANQTKGNINDGLIRFTGDVKGKAKQKEGDVTFKGDKADLYLEKQGGSYKAKKVIVNDKSVFTQTNKRIDSNYIELDLVKNEVYAKNTPVLTIDNANKGKTVVKSESVTGFIDKELINLKKDVHIRDINEKNEETVLTANRGSVTRTIADVYGNVKVVTKDAVMTANEGHYDMTTRKIKAKGNVHVDYVTAKSIGTSLNDAMNSKKGAK